MDREEKHEGAEKREKQAVVAAVSSNQWSPVLDVVTFSCCALLHEIIS